MREVNGKPLREVGYGSLSTGICRDLGEGRVGVHGRNVQDRTPLSADHILREDLRRKQRAEEVKIEHKGNARFIQIEEGLDTLQFVA